MLLTLFSNWNVIKVMKVKGPAVSEGPRCLCCYCFDRFRSIDLRLVIDCKPNNSSRHRLNANAIEKEKRMKERERDRERLKRTIHGKTKKETET